MNPITKALLVTASLLAFTIASFCGYREWRIHRPLAVEIASGPGYCSYVPDPVGSPHRQNHFQHLPTTPYLYIGLNPESPLPFSDIWHIWPAIYTTDGKELMASDFATGTDFIGMLCQDLCMDSVIVNYSSEFRDTVGFQQKVYPAFTLHFNQYKLDYLAGYVRQPVPKDILYPDEIIIILESFGCFSHSFKSLSFNSNTQGKVRFEKYGTDTLLSPSSFISMALKAIQTSQSKPGKSRSSTYFIAKIKVNNYIQIITDSQNDLTEIHELFKIYNPTE
jgi:hypothetical protein